MPGRPYCQGRECAKHEHRAGRRMGGDAGSAVAGVDARAGGDHSGLTSEQQNVAKSRQERILHVLRSEGRRGRKDGPCQPNTSRKV